MPAPPPLQGQVALVTGAAGGIGAPRRPAPRAGAAVVLVDLAEQRLVERRAHRAARRGRGACGDRRRGGPLCRRQRVLTGRAGVRGRRPGRVRQGSPAAAVEATSAEAWDQLRGARSRDLPRGAGGVRTPAAPRAEALVLVGSKNALAISKGSAHSSAKAAALHLARCMAVEGAPDGIRVNTVNPDAVIEGSSIWEGEWRDQRARDHGIEPGEVEEFYRKRSLLGPRCGRETWRRRSPSPPGAASRSTGNVINVDGGNPGPSPDDRRRPHRRSEHPRRGPRPGGPRPPAPAVRAPRPDPNAVRQRLARFEVAIPSWGGPGTRSHASPGGEPRSVHEKSSTVAIQQTGAVHAAGLPALPLGPHGRPAFGRGTPSAWASTRSTRTPSRTSPAPPTPTSSAASLHRCRRAAPRSSTTWPASRPAWPSAPGRSPSGSRMAPTSLASRTEPVLRALPGEHGGDRRRAAGGLVCPARASSTSRPSSTVVSTGVRAVRGPAPGRPRAVSWTSVTTRRR